MAVAAMSFTLSSCDKDVDPDVPTMHNYWIDITADGLNTAGQAAFDQLVSDVVFDGANHYVLYQSESYARGQFKAVVKSMTPESDFVQNVLVPTAAANGSNNFKVTLTLSLVTDTEAMTMKLIDSHEFSAASLLQ